jgi:HSP20 family molecular chaperone IbpA
MTDTRLAKHEKQTAQRVDESQAQPIYVPYVDISENKERIRLLADMPGVDQKSVDVTVENNVLIIEGPEGYQRIGQEFAVGKYRRDFTLTNTVDTEAIKARVNQGVLEVTLPKREEARTRKIVIAN